MRHEALVICPWPRGKGRGNTHMARSYRRRFLVITVSRDPGERGGNSRLASCHKVFSNYRARGPEAHACSRVHCPSAVVCWELLGESHSSLSCPGWVFILGFIFSISLFSVVLDFVFPALLCFSASRCILFFPLPWNLKRHRRLIDVPVVFFVAQYLCRDSEGGKTKREENLISCLDTVLENADIVF